MSHVKDLMRPAVLVKDTDSLHAVLEKMVYEKRNSLTVVDENGVLVGAVNAIDVIRAVVPDYLEEDQTAAHFADDSLLQEEVEKNRNLLVREFMATDIPTITEKTGLVEATVIAVCEGRGRITVVNDEKKPVGVLTRTELKMIIAGYAGINEPS